MHILSLFIGGERLELFKDESVSLTQTIQNVKDIGSIFTDFSKSFTVPASKTNNRIFKHYYDDGIVDGFNANDKLPATILLNQQEFRRGFMALEGTKMRNNKPYAYRITFFGETVDLKKKLKEVGLQNVFESVTIYNHDYNIANVRNGLRGQLGLGTGNSVIYPLISHTERLFYDSGSHSAGSRNLSYQGTSNAHNQGIRYTDLKPALKLSKIIDEIQTFTGLEFNTTDSDSFFNTSTNELYDKMYLWLARQKGILGASYSGGETFRIPITQLGYINGDLQQWYDFGDPTTSQDADCYRSIIPTNQIPIPCRNSSISNGIWTTKGWYYDNGQGYPNWQQKSESFSYTITITSTSSEPFNIYVENVTQETYIQASSTGNVGTGTLSGLAYDILNPVPDATSLRFVVETQDPNFLFTADVKLKKTYSFVSFFSSGSTVQIDQRRDIAPTTALQRIVVGDQMPNIRVLEFLTGLFKMFNLTAFVQPDGKVKVMTLDNFFATGVERDITKYIDKNKSDIDFAIPYQEIAFRFQNPKTFLAFNYNEINNAKFGFLENATQLSSIQSTDRGNKYVITLPFEKVIYERLTDTDSVQTNISYGWAVDKDQNPTLNAPLLFIRRNTQTGSKPLSFYSGVNGNTAQSLPQYNRASNSLSNETINFGSEIDEWTGIVKSQSLFNDYYLNYIRDVFNAHYKRTRIANAARI